MSLRAVSTPVDPGCLSHAALLRACRHDLVALREAGARASDAPPSVQESGPGRSLVDVTTHLLEIVALLERAVGPELAGPQPLV